MFGHFQFQDGGGVSFVINDSGDEVKQFEDLFSGNGRETILARKKFESGTKFVDFLFRTSFVAICQNVAYVFELSETGFVASWKISFWTSVRLKLF